jgi:Mrp family chromosome partitioning ATPase
MDRYDFFEMLVSDKMKNILNIVKEKYDFVFIDSPCIKHYNDPLLLSMIADEIILVVEANKTPKRKIIMAINKLERDGGKMIRLLLNKQINYVPEIIQELINI